MPVAMRQVPSPTPDPLLATEPPRMRFVTPVEAPTQPALVMVPVQGNTMQTVQVAEVSPTMPVVPMQTAPGSPDGFRPRGSVR
jgi:hypothetical protein